MPVFLLILCVAFIFTLFTLWREAGSRGINPEHLLDLFLLVSAVQVLGSRLGYLLLVGKGSGFLLFSGLLSGIFVFYIFVRRKPLLDFHELGDILAPGLTFLLALLPLRCFFVGCTREGFLLETAFLGLLTYIFIQLPGVLPESRLKKGVLWYAYSLLVPVFYLSLDLFTPLLNVWDRIFAVALSLLAVIGFLRCAAKSRAPVEEDLRLALTFKSRLQRRPLTMQNLPHVNFSLPQQFIKQIRFKLLRQKQELEEEIKLIETEDPFKDVERVENNAELVSEAVEQSGHLFIDQQVKFLKKTLQAVQNALVRIAKGTYGFSVKSGKPIPQERLEAQPVAELTVEEEEEKEKVLQSHLPPMERIN